MGGGAAEKEEQTGQAARGGTRRQRCQQRRRQRGPATASLVATASQTGHQHVKGGVSGATAASYEGVVHAPVPREEARGVFVAGPCL